MKHLIITWMTLLLSSSPALATPSLAQLIETPLGRFLLTETEAGINLTYRILRVNPHLSSEQIRRLPEMLSRAEYREVGSELQVRLLRIQDRLQAVRAVEPSVDVLQALRKLSTQELRLTEAGGRLRFVNPPRMTRGFSDSMDSFINGSRDAAIVGRSLDNEVETLHHIADRLDRVSRHKPLETDASAGPFIDLLKSANHQLLEATHQLWWTEQIVGSSVYRRECERISERIAQVYESLGQASGLSLPARIDLYRALEDFRYTHEKLLKLQPLRIEMRDPRPMDSRFTSAWYRNDF